MLDSLSSEVSLKNCDASCVKVTVNGIEGVTELKNVLSLDGVFGVTVDSEVVQGCSPIPYYHSPGYRIAKDFTMELTVGDARQLIDKLGGLRAATDGSMTFDLTVTVFDGGMTKSFTAQTCRIIDTGWGVTAGASDLLLTQIVLLPLSWDDDNSLV